MDGFRIGGSATQGSLAASDGQPLITAEAVDMALREARRAGSRFIEVDPDRGTVRPVRPLDGARPA